MDVTTGGPPSLGYNHMGSSVEQVRQSAVAMKVEPLQLLRTVSYSSTINQWFGVQAGLGEVRTPSKVDHPCSLTLERTMKTERTLATPVDLGRVLCLLWA